jgi:hypothetical protein
MSVCLCMNHAYAHECLCDVMYDMGLVGHMNQTCAHECLYEAMHICVFCTPGVRSPSYLCEAMHVCISWIADERDACSR